MKLVELIIDILEESLVPLKQGEILELAENHFAYVGLSLFEKI